MSKENGCGIGRCPIISEKQAGFHVNRCLNAPREKQICEPMDADEILQHDIEKGTQLGAEPGGYLPNNYNQQQRRYDPQNGYPTE